jgi:D-alanyl-D-alanine carboxypeptidase (penicillin-binding protein 5/6)
MRRRHLFSITALLVVAVVAAYGFISYRRPLPALAVQPTDIVTNKAQTPVLSWPQYGESAIGAVGYGVLDTNGAQGEVPTASAAKIMTTLALLRKYPLTLGEQGPTITMTSEDVTLYNTYVAEDGSVVKVVAGEQLTEYQALEALLLPSADNMADTLAVWGFGSISGYTSYANSMAKQLGMNNSYFSDASGFSPETVSNAHDLVTLGEVALQNPVVAQIVSERAATLPVAGEVKNVNWLLGSYGIDGIKTGNTTQAGGVYLFSAKQTLQDGKSITVVGSVMGAPTLAKAIDDAVPLLQSAEANFKSTVIVQNGQLVGSYKDACRATTLSRGMGGPADYPPSSFEASSYASGQRFPSRHC